MGNGKGDVHLIIYIAGAWSEGYIRVGCFFCLQGKKFFLTGEKLLEGKGEKYNR